MTNIDIFIALSGHGPFSHLFESLLDGITVRFYYGRQDDSIIICSINQHEKLSTRILKELIYQGNEYRFTNEGLEESDITKIENMIERSEEFVSSPELSVNQ